MTTVREVIERLGEMNPDAVLFVSDKASTKGESSDVFFLDGGNYVIVRDANLKVWKPGAGWSR